MTPPTNDAPRIHPTAEVSPEAHVGARTRVWHRTQIGAGARIGDDCIIGSNIYIDRDVVIGDNVKIQTGAQLYHGAVVETGVFIGPAVCLTNDKYPRAITPAGRLQTDADWEVGAIRVRYGASLGTGAIILPNVTVGRFAMVAAGAVVARSVPDYGLVIGQPARLSGYVCACGRKLATPDAQQPHTWTCVTCELDYLEQPEGGLIPNPAGPQVADR